MDFQKFYEGKEFEAYRFLGAHKEEGGVYFRTFAPDAAAVSLIGECNCWQETPMHRIYDGNFWECYAEGAAKGQMYKYRIYRKDGSFRDHCDPYGFYAQLRPDTASIVWELGDYAFRDEEWLKKRSCSPEKPLHIYEIHAGSWRQKPGAKSLPEGWLNYRELADLLVPYLKENGYNYLELMPLAEHPSDESWGYQNTGFYSPTSRYGTPRDLRYLVDHCHQNDIGVLMDFVPVHFAVDDYGLAQYDGTCLYEYPNSDVGQSEWGSCNFMHSRGEVRSFLQSAAYYWLAEFHFDGLRMDAVSNLIYWQGNPNRGVNKGAVDFLRTMNEGLKKRVPSVLLIAEDSTSYPNVTRPAAAGGLGFDYKWDMGFMNDTLSYFQCSPQQRVDVYHKLTFSMMYYYNERFLLPLSHDENVHGKGTILQKMHGDYEVKFPQARAFYLYLMAHPGKKLNFCGNEIGQLREWDEKREQDWDILRYPVHDGFHRFMMELNHIYLNMPALWAEDYDRDGFVWLDCHQEERCIYAFLRRGRGQKIIAVFNFSDCLWEDYYLSLNAAEDLTGCRFRLLFDTDRRSFGGSGAYTVQTFPVDDGMLRMSLPAFSGAYLLAEG